MAKKVGQSKSDYIFYYFQRPKVDFDGQNVFSMDKRYFPWLKGGFRWPKDGF